MTTEMTGGEAARAWLAREEKLQAERVKRDVLNDLAPGNGYVEPDGYGLHDAITDVATEYHLDRELVAEWVREHEATH